MRLIHVQPVYAQLLKGDHIVLFPFVHQLIQPRLKGFPGFFHLFDGKALPVAVFQLGDRIRDFVDLFPEKPFLPLCRDRDLLELGMSDDNGIIIAGGDPGAELLPVFRFKIPLAGHQQLRTGVQTQEFIRPLQRQVVRHHE